MVLIHYRHTPQSVHPLATTLFPFLQRRRRRTDPLHTGGDKIQRANNAQTVNRPSSACEITAHREAGPNIDHGHSDTFGGLTKFGSKLSSINTTI